MTFDRNTYAKLIVQYRYKVITNDSKNEKAIALAEKLSHRENRSPEENTLLDLLVTLIEKFKNEYYPIPDVAPLEFLKHLMEAQGLIPEDLVGVIGSRGVVSEVMNGKRSISNTQAKALGKFFSVEPSLLLFL